LDLVSLDYRSPEQEKESRERVFKLFSSQIYKKNWFKFIKTILLLNFGYYLKGAAKTG
jgi:hypothetical protein